MTAFDQAFQAAAAIGITVCVASGDNGSSDGVDRRRRHVDFPASSPNALACGGTSLQAANGDDQQRDGLERRRQRRGRRRRRQRPCSPARVAGGIDGVTAGGGRDPLAMRGVPDVAGDADPETGYDVRVDGHRHRDRRHQRGGAALGRPDRADQRSKGSPVGFVNPILYGRHAGGACATSPKATTATIAAPRLGRLHRARQSRAGPGERPDPAARGAGELTGDDIRNPSPLAGEEIFVRLGRGPYFSIPRTQFRASFETRPDGRSSG